MSLSGHAVFFGSCMVEHSSTTFFMHPKERLLPVDGAAHRESAGERQVEARNTTVARSGLLAKLHLEPDALPATIGEHDLDRIAAVQRRALDVPATTTLVIDERHAVTLPDVVDDGLACGCPIVLLAGSVVDEQASLDERRCGDLVELAPRRVEQDQQVAGRNVGSVGGLGRHGGEGKRRALGSSNRSNNPENPESADGVPFWTEQESEKTCSFSGRSALVLPGARHEVRVVRRV